MKEIKLIDVQTEIDNLISELLDKPNRYGLCSGCINEFNEYVQKVIELRGKRKK